MCHVRWRLPATCFQGAPRSRIDLVVVPWPEIFGRKLHELCQHRARGRLLVVIINALGHLVSFSHNVEYCRCDVTPLSTMGSPRHHDRHAQAFFRGVETSLPYCEVSLKSTVMPRLHP